MKILACCKGAPHRVGHRRHVRRGCRRASTSQAGQPVFVQEGMCRLLTGL